MNLVERANALVRGCAAAVAAMGLASCASLPAGPAESPRTVIRNVTVIPMGRTGSIPAQDVVVADGRVVAMVRSGSVRARAGDQVLDGSGKYLMPGLWDMHTHAVMGGPGAAREALSLYLANGVVGVRDLGSTLEDLSAARKELPIGTELPHLVAGGPLLDGPKQPWQQKIALALNSVDEARAAAEQLADDGVDFFKIYNNLSAAQFAAVAEVARRRGLPMVGHVPFKISLEQVSEAGQKSIEHAGVQLVKDCIPDGAKATPAILNAWIKDGYPGKYEETSRWWPKRDQSACQALYARMAARGTWVTPTLTNEIQGGIWATPYDLDLLSPDRLKACQSNLESVNSRPASRDTADKDVFNLVLNLHKAGVPLLAGTDTPNSCLAYGSSLHKELQMLHHAGLSPWEVLKTATINPARFLGRADEGAVRKGAVANLLLLHADPLADISNTRRIAGVMLGGRWQGADTLKQAPLPGAQASSYDNALVWTGSGFEKKTLAVHDGRFVDPATAVGAVRTDLAGSFIVPGYGNAHAHITNPTPAGSWNFLKEGVFYVWNPNTVVMDAAAQAFFARKDTVDVLLAQGGITEPGGHPEKLYVDVLTKYVYKGKTLKDFLGNAFHYGRGKAEIDAALDLLKTQGSGLVKSYLLHSEEYSRRRDDSAYYGGKGINPANLPYLVTAARKRGLPVIVHVETVVDLKVAALSGAAVAAHLPGYSGDPTNDLRTKTLSGEDAALIAGTGMLLVPTYALAAGRFAETGKNGKLDRGVQARTYAMQAQNIRLLKQAGATFLMGTDTSGQIFEEAEHLLQIGALTLPEALKMVFDTPRHMFAKRRIGCFDIGCEADFLVLSADPTKNISNLREIVRRVKNGVQLVAK